MKIGGTLIVHNGIRGDYCFLEAVKSLAIVCDSVVVLDAESDDGTFEQLTQLQTAIPSIRLVRGLWRPSKNGTWLADLTNQARNHLETEWHLNLQADEVVDPRCGNLLRLAAASNQSILFRRWNFWNDIWTTLHPAVCVSGWVYRFAPRWVPSVGDAESLDQVQHTNTIRSEDASIFHYGFIRSAEGFVYKSIPMQEAFFGTHDPILDEIPKVGMGALRSKNQHALTPWAGQHPEVAHDWLRKNGHNPQR